MYSRQEIVSVEGIHIAYSGEELRQDDQDVFLQLLHMARAEDLANALMVTPHAVLAELGRGRGGDKYETLKKSIARLRGGTLWVTFPKTEGTEADQAAGKGFSGNMLATFDWDGEQWRTSFDPRIVALFTEDGYTRINWNERLKFGPLAKWLHSFYFTHHKPFPYTVQRLYELCGSKTKELKHFRARLKLALDELKKEGFLESWEHDARSDKISVVRNHAKRLNS